MHPGPALGIPRTTLLQAVSAAADPLNALREVDPYPAATATRSRSRRGSGSCAAVDPGYPTAKLLRRARSDRQPGGRISRSARPPGARHEPDPARHHEQPAWLSLAFISERK